MAPPSLLRYILCCLDIQVLLICVCSALSALIRPIPTVRSPGAPVAMFPDTLPLSILAFEVPNSGTYWYHSHLSTQYLDGLRGVIVVYVRFRSFLERPAHSYSGS
jgi:hypothetical protein